MDNQDTKFNYKLILAAMAAVIIGVIIAFYFSYSQSASQISILDHEKDLLVKDLTIMKAEVDRLSALDEVNDIELQTSRYKVERLLDSVGKLTFTIAKLREYKTELRRLAAKNDSLKLKNDLLTFNNLQLTEKFEASEEEIAQIRNNNEALSKAQADKRDKIQAINEALKTKKYLTVENAEGNGVRVKSGKNIQTNKASTIKRLNACVSISADSDLADQERVIYFQFVGPNMGIIEDNASTVNVHGNVYSKRVEVNFNGEQIDICDFISIPEGSLEPGDYILNIFENERFLQTSEFQLK